MIKPLEQIRKSALNCDGAQITQVYAPTLYRDRLRILLILYFFSEDYRNEDTPELVKVLYSEVKIQKIDFLIRYPDYFCYELIKEQTSLNKDEIKDIIRDIFHSKEPEIRREEMLRYIYGAYEDIDNIISFWISTNFINYKCKVNTIGKYYDKAYYITKKGKDKIEKDILNNMEGSQWYIRRCQLIKKYFYDMSGTELKERQYKHPEYKNTNIGCYISEIGEKVRKIYFEEYGEVL